MHWVTRHMRLGALYPRHSEPYQYTDDKPDATADRSDDMLGEESTCANDQSLESS